MDLQEVQQSELDQGVESFMSQIEPVVKGEQFTTENQSITSNLGNIHELILNSVNKEELSKDDPLSKLFLLKENSEQVDMKVFCWNDWYVVADNQESITSNMNTLNSINDFQDLIDPNRLWSQCVSVHEAAELYGVADSSLTARKIQIQDKSIYRIRGIHNIAVKDTEGNSIYFDLTSRAYVLSPGDDVEQSIGKGIVVIDKKYQTIGIDALYKCNWERTKLGGSEESKVYIQRIFNGMKKVRE